MLIDEFCHRGGVADRLSQMDRSLLLGAAIFAVSTAFGAAVSVKENVRGEPLGIDVPGSVGVHLVVGWGSGVSAPWPMPALVLGAAVCGGPDARWVRGTFVGVGTAVLVGTLIEPVTWRRRSWSPLAAASVLLNLVSAVALLTAGHERAATALSTA